MKEEMESVELAAALRELKKLEGAYLQKVYKPGEEEILFRVYKPGLGSRFLLFRVGQALFITDRDKENPKRPGDYVMLMRKYIGNSTIVNIEQHEFDRVVVMELEKEDSFKLIFEVFGKGNLILIGKDQIILPYSSETWKHRELKEGAAYKFPPSRRDPMDFDRDEMDEMIEGAEKDLVRTLAVDFNLGGKYAEELCERLGVDKNTEDFEGIKDRIWDELQDLKAQIFEKNIDPYTVHEDEEIVDAVPFPLEIYKDKEKKKRGSYNLALDLSFRGVREEEEKEKETSSRSERKLEQQKRALEDLKKEEKNDKIRAELIYQNYQRCEELLDKIHQAREENRREEVYEELRNRDRIVQLNDSDEYIVVELEGEKDGEHHEMNVRLNFREDVNENAQRYYEKSKKSKKKIEGAKEAIEETKAEIEEGKVEEKSRKRKKPTASYWFDRFKWFISSGGHLVVAGKDSQTNEEVVKKYLEKGDRYAHAGAGGAPSVVIKEDKDLEDIDEEELREVSQYSVIHSKEWKRGIASGRAYWVKPLQVSKTAESGESLPTGAFVIRGNRNYLDGLEMKAVLAEIEYKGNRKVMCAPSETVENRDDDFTRRVVFIPGKKDSNEFAKEMSDFFHVPIKEIQKIIPPGDVEVLEKRDREEKK